MYVRNVRVMGILECIIGTVVTVIAIGFTMIMGVILIILPVCGFLWALGSQMWSLELPRIAPIDAIVMTVFIGLPICGLLWIAGEGLCSLHKGKLCL